MKVEHSKVERLCVTVLVENSVYQPDLLAEHGLAFLVEADGFRLLFDTGQGRALLGNARQLNIHLDGLDAVVVSHGHFDHTGGVADVLRLEGRQKVYMHPAAIEPKYSRRKIPPHREIGIPEAGLRALETAEERIVWTRAPERVFPGVCVSGEIPRITTFEDTGGDFYRDETCMERDALLDDQALVVNTSLGLVVILGCGHAGVVNTLEHASRLTGQSSIRAVLGGMHLMRASAERIESTRDSIDRRQVEKVAPCHCTGWKAIAHFRSSLGERVLDCSTGSKFVFEG
jgi:7,8-dihydropterin-6-yl-methyl-4-(beta-D-ribofuranosyl)aminobenzene 5'-phosphate synthase